MIQQRKRLKKKKQMQHTTFVSTVSSKLHAGRSPIILHGLNVQVMSDNGYPLHSHDIDDS